MSDRWDFYLCRVNDELASISLNLGLRPDLPQAERPHLLWLWLDLRAPRPDGLSSKEEADTLWAIEDALTPPLLKTCNAILAGRITTCGRREYYFYAPNAERFAEVVAEALKKFPDYTSETGAKEDPDWDQYLNVLYPGPRDIQRMKNRGVVEQLVKHGDTLQHPRDVQHWIYFRTPENRQAFSERVVAKGFRTLTAAPPKPDVERPHSLSVVRADRVDLNSINPVVLDLFELANEMDADYDGWETAVVK